MILRIIALAIVVCLALATFGLAGQKSLLPEDTSHLSNPELSITEQHRSVILGLAVGLATCGAALMTEHEETRGCVLVLGILAFLWIGMET
jgi:hypothetical protein